MPAGAQARLRALATATEPTTVPEVIERLRAIDGALPAKDGVAWFVKLYLAVTEAVQARLGRRKFRDPRFLTRLDVVFANLFLAALEASLTRPSAIPRAWAPLFEARARRGVAPIQFALAGMNAHINRDLPVALVDTSAELGIDLEHAAPEHADFVAVNPVLARTETSVKHWFATGFVGVVDSALGEVDDRIAMWDLVRAREAAWTQGRALWALRGLRPLEEAYLETLDRTVGFAGRGLLVPVEG